MQTRKTINSILSAYKNRKNTVSSIKERFGISGTNLYEILYTNGMVLRSETPSNTAARKR